MLPLFPSTRPGSPEALLQQLTAGLNSVFEGTAQIRSDRNTLSIRLERTGVLQVPQFLQPPKPEDSDAALRVSTFDFQAQDVLLWNCPVTLESNFSDATFFWARGNATHSVLMLGKARAGRISVCVRQTDLKDLIACQLGSLAASQGFEVLNCEVQLMPGALCAKESTASKSVYSELQVQLQVQARAFVMQVSLGLSGRLRITDDLHLVFSELRCEGTGMAVTAAKAFLTPVFKKLEGTPVQVSSFLPPGLPLRSLKMECDTVFGVLADFGPDAEVVPGFENPAGEPQVPAPL